MSATDTIRAMLDERGVEYTQANATGGTLFIVVTSEEYYFILVRDNDAGIEMWSKDLTPEKAIAATLGPRTCRKLPSSGETRCFVSRNGCEMEFGYWKCSNCGVECFEGAKYCMNCGAKAEDCGTKVVDYG